MPAGGARTVADPAPRISPARSTPQHCPRVLRARKPAGKPGRQPGAYGSAALPGTAARHEHPPPNQGYGAPAGRLPADRPPGGRVHAHHAGSHEREAIVVAGSLTPAGSDRERAPALTRVFCAIGTLGPCASLDSVITL